MTAPDRVDGRQCARVQLQPVREAELGLRELLPPEAPVLREVELLQLGLYVRSFLLLFHVARRGR